VLFPNLEPEFINAVFDETILAGICPEGFMVPEKGRFAGNAGKSGLLYGITKSPNSTASQP